MNESANVFGISTDASFSENSNTGLWDRIKPLQNTDFPGSEKGMNSLFEGKEDKFFVITMYLLMLLV